MNIKIITIVLVSFYLLSLKADNSKKVEQRDGQDYAIFFAVKDYENWSDLKTPIDDAKAISKILEEKYDFKTEILENPTKIQIRRKIAALQKKKYKNDDQILLFFTGHGEYVKALEKGYFIPSDAKKNDEFRESYLYYPDIKPDIDNIPCRHILMVLDACFSGSFLQYRSNDERPGKSSERNELIENNLNKRCRKGITSGGFKRVPDGIYHSPFTNKFLDALNSLGGEDRVLTNEELFVKLDGGFNPPRKGHFGKEDSDSRFLFIAKNKKLVEENWQIDEHRKVDSIEWTKAKQVNTIEGYKDYLLSFSNGLYAIEAYRNIIKLEDEDGFTDNSRKFKNIPPEYETGGFSDNSGVFIDSRDKQLYKWVKMKDGKIWMAENLNYDTSDSYCYDDKKKNCTHYGQLYKLNSAIKACPPGWRLPSNEEWKQLILLYGCYFDWDAGNWKGIGETNKSYDSLTSEGFSALHGGKRGTFGEYKNLGESNCFWSSTNYDTDNFYSYRFSKSFRRVIRYNSNKDNAMSCRCIKDFSD